MVKLGDEVKDVVSGFQGIAIAKHIYLNGCTRVSVQPKVKKDKSLPDACTFDEPQLQVLKHRVVSQGLAHTGGPEKYMPEDRPQG